MILIIHIIINMYGSYRTERHVSIVPVCYSRNRSARQRAHRRRWQRGFLIVSDSIVSVSYDLSVSLGTTLQFKQDLTKEPGEIYPTWNPLRETSLRTARRAPPPSTPVVTNDG
jgi:hypothetical protein